MTFGVRCDRGFASMDGSRLCVRWMERLTRIGAVKWKAPRPGRFLLEMVTGGDGREQPSVFGQ